MKTIAILLLPLFLLACAPFVYEPRVDKINPNGPWLQGRQIHTDTLGDLVAMIQYEKATPEALIFTIGVSNIGNGTYLVDPLLFISRGYDFDPRERDTAKYSITKPVFDPEKILVRLKNNIAEAKAEGSDVAGFLQILTLIRPPNETPAERTERITFNTNYAIKGSLNDLKKQNVVQQKEQGLAIMENILLRKNTLMPGRFVGGQVYFNRHNKSRKIVITLPVGEKTFRFDFLHELTKQRI